jgi:hypothetical protein
VHFSTPNVSAADNDRHRNAVAMDLRDLARHIFCGMDVNAGFRSGERFSRNL